ncbi:MAG: hypothetical protein NT038_07945 [Euryarchaeota archaeon]|nr:hypothetical protein [Euryarchaeota archaeon]
MKEVKVTRQRYDKIVSEILDKCHHKLVQDIIKAHIDDSRTSINRTIKYYKKMIKTYPTDLKIEPNQRTIKTAIQLLKELNERYIIGEKDEDRDTIHKLSVQDTEKQISDLERIKRCAKDCDKYCYKFEECQGKQCRPMTQKEKNELQKLYQHQDKLLKIQSKQHLKEDDVKIQGIRVNTPAPIVEELPDQEGWITDPESMDMFTFSGGRKRKRKDLYSEDWEK